MFAVSRDKRSGLRKCRKRSSDKEREREREREREIERERERLFLDLGNKDGHVH